LSIRSLLLVRCIAAFGAMFGLKHASAAEVAKPSGLLIGVVGAFSGGSAPLGVSLRDGVRLAIADINKAGGIHGRRVELVEIDDEGRQLGGIAAAKKLVRDHKVTAAIAFSNSPVALVASRYFQEAEVPLIIPVATGTMLTQQFQQPDMPLNFVFRVSMFDAMQSRIMVEEALTRHKASKIAILHDSTGYGRGGRDDIMKALKEKNVAPITVQEFNLRDTDMAAQLTRARDAGADMILGYSLGPELGHIARGTKAMNWDVKFLTSWTSAMGNFLDAAKDAADGVTMPQSAVDAPGVRQDWSKFFARYREAFKTDRIGSASSAAQGHDAALLLAAALRDAGPKADGSKIHRALKSMGNPVQGLIATYVNPFSNDDQEALNASHVIMGTILNGRVEPVR
jgi:branched-chain amino acid transport system substrate-binding protein